MVLSLKMERTGFTAAKPVNNQINISLPSLHRRCNGMDVLFKEVNGELSLTITLRTANARDLHGTRWSMGFEVDESGLHETKRAEVFGTALRFLDPTTFPPLEVYGREYDIQAPLDEDCPEWAILKDADLAKATMLWLDEGLFFRYQENDGELWPLLTAVGYEDPGGE